MTYYEYKRVRDLLPDGYLTTENFQRKCCGDKGCIYTKHPCEYDGDANYDDGGMWTMTAYYIKELQEKIELLTNTLKDIVNHTPEDYERADNTTNEARIMAQDTLKQIG